MPPLTRLIIRRKIDEKSRRRRRAFVTALSFRGGTGGEEAIFHERYLSEGRA